MLNQHLEPEKSHKVGSQKKPSFTDQTEEKSIKMRNEPITETASSHHDHQDEDSASLGKRSLSESTGEMKIIGKRKDISHFLESVALLEDKLAGLESLVSGITPTEARPTDNLTLEVKIK